MTSTTPTTAWLFHLSTFPEKRRSALHRVRIATFVDGEAEPKTYGTLKQACTEGRRHGWTFTPLPAEGHLPVGWYDLEEATWSLVHRLMAGPPR